MEIYIYIQMQANGSDRQIAIWKDGKAEIEP